MKRVLSLALAAALVVPFVARAQAKPDFSGSWTLDASKSDAPAGRAGGGGGGRGGGGGGRGGGGAAGPMDIKQTAADITIRMQTYKLDGSEVEVAGGRGGAAKAKAAWEGSKLVITTNRDMQGTAITQKAVYSLSADGKELTVENTLTGLPQGGGTTKQVYTKN